MPTTNQVPSTDPTDLLFNAGKLDEVVNGTANSFTDRLGIARRTVAGMNADFDAQLADAESDLNIYRADAAASAAEALGYLQTIRATSYGAYASDPATDPLGNPPTVGDEYFNTTSNLLKRWNGTTWQASDINTANLAASSGSSLVGYDGGTVQDVLDDAKSLQDYAALRAYTGRAKRIYITGLLVTAKPAGISGIFQYDQTDTTSADNGGSIIVGADGRRWKRDYSGNVSAAWFEAVGNGIINDTQKLQAAVNYCIANKKNLTIPPSATAYMIDAVGSGATPNTNGGIVINGPITIFMYGAKLKAITNSSESYVVLNIRNASNVCVFGGEIEGDRTTHTGAGGEQGHGVVITGSTDVRLQDVYVSSCWGDCIGLRTDGNTASKRIRLDSVVCDGARRNGLTVQLVDGLFVTGSSFKNTGGIAPQAGVDIETNPSDGAAKNCIFSNCYFSANASYDFIGNGDAGGLENVIVSDSVFADTIASGIVFTGTVLCKNIEVANNVMSMRAASGIGVTIGSGVNVKVLDNVITRSGVYSADSSAGLYADGISTNVVFRGNQLSGFRQGIQIQSSTVVLANIEHNEISGCSRGILANNTANKISIKHNSFRNLLNYGIQASFVDCVITDNTFEDIALRATSISATNCAISQNVFNRVGTTDQVTEPCLGFTGAAENCVITNNVFYSATASQDAIRASVAPAASSFFSGNVARYGNQTDVFVLHASHIVGENFANTVSSGTFTLNAAATRSVTNNNVTAASKILLTPTNASAATLMSGSKALYVSTKTVGTSFTVATADGTAAAGTETFDYRIVN